MLFGGFVLATWAAGLSVARASDPTVMRVGSGVIALSILLAPVALVWVVGEAHGRWSPRRPLARGLVGGTLWIAVLSLILACAPFALYGLIASLGNAFGW